MILAIVAAGMLSVSPGDSADSARVDSSSAFLIVTSTPDSAEVYVDSLSVGNTPCSTRVSAAVPHTLLVLQSPANAWSADAVEETVMTAPGETVRRHILFRPPSFIGPPADRLTREGLDVTGASLLNPPRWRLYLTGGGALLAGAAAAYFKGRADDRHSEFLITRDPAASAARDRDDRTSTVFLVAAEVSFGLFLAFLLSE